MRAIVIGAGIGGVTTALALARRGVDCAVYERAGGNAEVGAGISLWGNAVAALREIGVAGPVVACGERMRVAELREWRGGLLTASRVGELDDALGDPSVLMHRAELLGALLGQCATGVVRFGHEFERYTEEAGKVAAHFANGVVDTADVLIGADGVQSAVRGQVIGDEPVRYAGYTCWRGVAEVPESVVPASYVCEYWGKGQRFGITRLTKGRVYWFATKNTPPDGRDEGAGLEHVARLFAGWAEPVGRVIGLTPAGAVLRNDIVDRPPSRVWGKGRVVLTGDAAHATTPNLGQGACMAIESAPVLARALVQRGAEGACAEFYSHRRARTSWVTRMSWRMGQVGQLENSVLRSARDMAVRCVPQTLLVKHHRRLVGYRP